MLSISSFTKWNAFLDAIKAYKLFERPARNEVMAITLAPVGTLAFALDKFVSLGNRDSIKICIAGAEALDSANGGDCFRLLPQLIGIENIQIDLVGFELRVSNNEYRLKPNIGSGVSVTFNKCSFEEYINTKGTPDVVMFNHPGFSMYGNEWFMDDNGIGTCIDNQVFLIGCSYGTDESEVDKYYARAFGFTISDPIDNPYHISQRSGITREMIRDMPGAKAAFHGFMDWGRQVWAIEGRTAKGRDEELEEVLSIRENFIERIGCNEPRARSRMFFEQTTII